MACSPGRKADELLYWRKKGFWFLLPLIVLLPAQSVRAQVDLTGEWSPRIYNENRDVGDFTGIPLSAAALYEPKVGPAIKMLFRKMAAVTGPLTSDCALPLRRCSLLHNEIPTHGRSLRTTSTRHGWILMSGWMVVRTLPIMR